MDLKTLNFKYSRLSEKLSSFRYSIPKNKKELMYDFYILSALPTWSLKTATNYASEADELEFVAKDTLEKVANYLQKDLLDSVYYAICCEFRHYLAFTTTAIIRKHKYRKFFEKYLAYVMKEFPNPHYSHLTPQDAFDNDSSYSYFDYFIDAAFFHNKDGRETSVAAINSAGVSKSKLIEIAQYCFDEGVWGHEDYGGHMWSKICDGWKKLDSARTLGDKVVYIDHVFDLQHNTDSVLNKSKEYADDNRNHAWISVALDDKKHATSLFDLTKKCTPSLKYFAARLIKAATGETFESYTKMKIADAIRNFG